MMKKGSSLLFLFILSIAFANAEVQVLGGDDGYPPGIDIPLIQICPNCTYVNITYLVLGDGNLLQINKAMTKDGTFYNYTLNKIYTNSTGEYIVNYIDDIDGTKDSGNYAFNVRKGGILLTTGEAILYIVLMSLNILGFFFFLYLSKKIPYSDERTKDGTISRLIKQKYLKLLAIWLCYGSLLWFMNLLAGLMNTFAYLEIAANLTSNLYIYLSWIGYGLSVTIMILVFLNVWADLLIPLFKRLLRINANRKK